MGRGRSSTNYSDAEKQLLLRAVASVRPRRASCWLRVEEFYNAHRSDSGSDASRDAHSLKRKFKTMANARTPRGGGGAYEDPYVARARQLLQQIKERADGSEDQGEYDDDETENPHGRADGATMAGSRYSEPEQQESGALQSSNGSVPENQQETMHDRTMSGRGAGRDDERHRLPMLAPLPPAAPRRSSRSASTERVAVNQTPTQHGNSLSGSSSVSGSDLAQLLLVIREENAQRELVRRTERAEAIAREERLREEARELRRQEREESAAREERYWHEMAEQRRHDREEAAARHEQIMAVLAALIKPHAAAATSKAASADVNRG